MLDRMLKRLVRLGRLEFTVFKEVGVDPQATREAAIIAVVASLMAALGGFALFAGSVTGLLSGIATGVVINWLLWSALAKLIAGLLYQHDVSFVSMARAFGYAMAPISLGILGIFGCLGDLASLVGWALSAFLGFHAVRENADLSTEGSVVTVALSAGVVLVIDALLRMVL